MPRVITNAKGGDIEYIGVLNDPRSEQEKELDYTHDGVALSSIPVEWIEKTSFKSYKIKNQDGSSSCVAQATAKLLGVHEVVEGREYKDLSPKYIYTRRLNYPSGGMWFQNALEIACKEGTCLESYLPSDMTDETFMNDKSQETETCRITAPDYKGKTYITITNPTMDSIAQVLSQGYAVLLGFEFDYNEWVEKPFVDPNSKNKCRHGVVAIDFGVYNGERVIAIDDSWGPGYGRGGQRLITEEFLSKKNIYAGYSIPFIKEVDINTEFHHQWSTVMRFKDPKNNIEEVTALQKALQTIGIFPKNAKVDGLYGPITRKAVYEFQKKYVDSTNYGVQVGPKTLEALNKKFK